MSNAEPTAVSGGGRISMDDEVAPKRKGWLGRFLCLPKFRLRKKKRKEKLSFRVDEAPRPLPMDVEDTYVPTIHDPPCTPVSPNRRGRNLLESGRGRIESGIGDPGYEVPPILEACHLQTLWTWLPARERIKNARIVYCTGRHGRSLQTLYRKAQQTWESSQGGFRRCKPAPECLLVMKTARGDFIGCYLTQWPRTLALRTSQELTGSTYLGTGESFVFAFHKDGEMRKGAWAEGRPTSFLHCSNSLLTVGDAAICVDQYLERVTSRPSKTFNTKEGLLWKDTDAHKFGKRGASGRASGDSCEDNLVSAAETEPGPKVSLEMTRGDATSWARGAAAVRDVSREGTSSLELSRNETPVLIRKQGSITVAPPSQEDSDIHDNVSRSLPLEEAGCSGGGGARAGLEGKMGDVLGGEGGVGWGEGGGGGGRERVFSSSSKNMGDSAIGGGESIIDVFNEEDIQTAFAALERPEREIERAFEALSREREIFSAGRLPNARGDGGGAGGGGMGGGRERVLLDKRVGEQKEEGKTIESSDDRFQKIEKKVKSRRCRSLDMERPVVTERRSPARFSFCEGEERRWEVSDGNDFDIVSLQLLRLE